MRKALILALLLACSPAAADGYLPPRPAAEDDCSYPCYEGSEEAVYGDPRWRRPPPRPWFERERVPRGTPHGAITPQNDVAYPLAPGHIQAPPDMRKAFPRGIPPGWFNR